MRLLKFCKLYGTNISVRLYRELYSDQSSIAVDLSFSQFMAETELVLPDGKWG